MAEKIEETIKHLIEEGRKKGFLTYSEMNKLLEEQFIPPERMDAIFVTLEDSGIEIQDDVDASAERLEEKDEPRDEVAVESEDHEHDDELPETIFPKSSLPEKIDDPVRMYLTQMGEIPLLTRDQEIYLAKTIEITRKRFRKKAIGSGLSMTRALKTLEEVARGELAFDRTLKVNPNPKPDDDPKIVETLGKNFLAKRLPVNLVTIRRLGGQVKEEYRPLLDPNLSRKRRSEQLERVQAVRRKLVILIEECHLQVKKVRPYIDLMEEHYREMRSIERKIAALKGNKKGASQVRELQD